jgi:hypothetical protein
LFIFFLDKTKQGIEKDREHGGRGLLFNLREYLTRVPIIILTWTNIVSGKARSWIENASVLGLSEGMTLVGLYGVRYT